MNPQNTLRTIMKDIKKIRQKALQNSPVLKKLPPDPIFPKHHTPLTTA